MFPLAQVTEVDQGGAVGEAVTDDHVGSPERLQVLSKRFEEDYIAMVPD
jgi:hypothetical protein